MKKIGDYCINKYDSWTTPKYLYDMYDKIYHFNLDPCSNDVNHLCSNYYTINDDGLSKKWFGSVFCNPPYGRGIAKWVEKGYKEYKNGVTVVFLLPARTDTKWFHDYLLKYANIIFIKGRLRFGNSKQNAPFASMICILDPNTVHISYN